MVFFSKALKDWSAGFVVLANKMSASKDQGLGFNSWFSGLGFRVTFGSLWIQGI